jgi:hypothetical protein
MQELAGSSVTAMGSLRGRELFGKYRPLLQTESGGAKNLCGSLKKKELFGPEIADAAGE